MLVFTKHALIKLSQRGIDRAEVEATVEVPDHFEETYEGRKAAYKKFGTRILKVVFYQTDDKIVIITQHWDSTIKLPL